MAFKSIPALNILHLERDCYPESALNRLENIGNLESFETDSHTELLSYVEGEKVEVIFVKLGLSIDKELMKHLPDLKYIVTPTTGLNHIDLNFAKEKNIKVISLKGESEFLKSITSTSEHTWGILLGLIRNLPQAYSDVLEGNWRRRPFMASELFGKTLGIVGYGRLGKIVAQYGEVFSMNVLVNDIDLSVFEASPYIQTELSQLLAESDVVSIHIPSNEENHHFINEQLFSQMKNGSVFINTSRGEVIDEKALLNYLENGKLAGAATDVLEGDSTWSSKSLPHHPLVEYAKTNSNLIITPHMGGYGKESIERTRAFITDKFISSCI